MVSIEKQYLNTVSVRLGLGGMPNLSALNEILAYVLDGTLRLYFDDDIDGVPIDGSFEQISDTKIMVSGESSSLLGRKTLIATNQYGIEKGYQISLSQFTHDGKMYYPVDVTGLWIEFIKLTPNSFYCMKNELDTFICNLNRKEETLLNKSTVSAKGKLRKKHILERRLDAFNAFCDERKITANLENSEHQTIYESFIPLMTKRDFYNELQKFDSKLFACASKGFYGNKRVNIEFNKGARNRK